MSASTLAYFLALGSATCFSLASLTFADLSRRVSPLWVNAFKAALAWVAFGVATLLVPWSVLSWPVATALVVSGAVGLGVGDIFLLTAYARMGSARTLILYGFQPLFVGVAAHFLFGQDISWMRLLAVIFFMSCLFVFSLERFRQDGHWEWRGLAAALAGVMFDNCGLLMSRWAFEQAPELSAIQANWIRCSGAVVFFLIFGRVRAIHFRLGWVQLGAQGRRWAVFSSFIGTFLSLFLYLTAVKIGHLASISSLAGVGPLISSLFECVHQRQWPSRFLLTALGLFLIGFAIMICL